MSSTESDDSVELHDITDMVDSGRPVLRDGRKSSVVLRSSTGRRASNSATAQINKREPDLVQLCIEGVKPE